MTTERQERAPAGLSPSGRRLWHDVSGRFELTEPERLLLVQACETATVIERLAGSLAEVVQADGRPSPVLAELRHQRLVLARLLGVLAVPGDDGGER